MSLELKSEFVQCRSAVTTSQFNVRDAIFSVDLEGIVDLMDPNRGSFTVMELLGYKVEPFADSLEWMNRIGNDISATGVSTPFQLGMDMAISLDTSVPDASQPNTGADSLAQEDRWIASATKIVNDRRNVRFTWNNNSTGASPVLTNSRGVSFITDWISLENEAGKGRLIAAPRLIVRFWNFIENNSSLLNTTPFEGAFQIRLKYKTKKISKNQMWQMLLQQTPGETLIRSGAAAFPS